MHTGITPVGKLSADQVWSVLAAASDTSAPHHPQPWYVHCTPTTIELHATPNRVAAAVADRRQLLLACGAALLNLRLAISAQGVYPDVRMLPDPARPELLAVMRPQSRRPVTPNDRQLAAAIGDHRSDHQPDASVVIPAAVRGELRRAAEIERAWLATLTPTQLPMLRAIVGRAHRASQDNPAFSAEWAAWAGGDGSGEQVPEPLIAVIGTFHDQSATHLQAGQAMQRVALTAATARLSTTLLSQVMEVPATRGELRDLIGGGLWPQILLRFEEAPPRSMPRLLDIEDVVTPEELVAIAGADG